MIHWVKKHIDVGFLVVIIFAISVYAYYRCWDPSPWAWKSRIDPRWQSIPLKIHYTISSLELEYYEEIGEYKFYITNGKTKVADFWRKQPEAPSLQTPPQDGTDSSIKNDSNPGSEELEKPSQEKKTKGEEKEEKGKTNKKEENKTTNPSPPKEPLIELSKSCEAKICTLTIDNIMLKRLRPPTKQNSSDSEKENTALPLYNDFYLIAASQHNFANVSYWEFPPDRNIFWKSVNVNQNKIEANVCRKNDFLGENCLLAAKVLSYPEMAMLNDPQQTIARYSRKGSTTYVIPGIINLMIVTNWILLGMLIFQIAFAIAKARKDNVIFGLIPNSQQGPGLPIHVDQSFRGVLLLLEWLEVIGPALGFLLTVVALLMAFAQSGSMAMQNTDRILDGLGAAMGATAAGLGIRILAFSNSKVFQRRTMHWSNHMGLLTINTEENPPPSLWTRLRTLFTKTNGDK